MIVFDGKVSNYFAELCGYDFLQFCITGIANIDVQNAQE
jgi:hypothetical protein